MRPTMRFVATKSEVKQAAATVFKVCDFLLRQKPQIINTQWASQTRSAAGPFDRSIVGSNISKSASEPDLSGNQHRGKVYLYRRLPVLMLSRQIAVRAI